MKRVVTPIALGIFFQISELLCALVFFTLIAPETPLDFIWLPKPDEHNDLMLLRPASTVLFLILAAAMGFASVGTFQRKRWGLNLAIAIFVINALGDAIRGAQGAWMEGAFGVTVATLIIWWLTRPRVRALFA